MAVTTLTRDQIIARNVAVVEAHFNAENPESIREALKLYADEISWEIPARGLVLADKEAVVREYLAMFGSASEITFEPIRKFADERYVFDDRIARLTITGPGWRNCPFPIGTRVTMRLLHVFEMTDDGKIRREIGYEIWRRAEDAHLINDAGLSRR
jgi:hypothetical protein